MVFGKLRKKRQERKEKKAEERHKKAMVKLGKAQAKLREPPKISLTGLTPPAMAYVMFRVNGGGSPESSARYPIILQLNKKIGNLTPPLTQWRQAYKGYLEVGKYKPTKTSGLREAIVGTGRQRYLKPKGVLEEALDNRAGWEKQIAEATKELQAFINEYRKEIEKALGNVEKEMRKNYPQIYKGL